MAPVESYVNQQLPKGVVMEVLVVDDDRACLTLLATMLRQCSYSVTTATRARAALELLRENKNKFDLVICDVVMPDMDGFQLLECVGLEMDLPVIMMSSYDPDRVLKGIKYGACDYLVKPVQIEQLRNIWQHVVLRKITDTKDNALLGSGEAAGMGKSYQNGKPSKKRRDQNEDEGEENEFRIQNLAPRKKSRLCWSRDLHEKFVEVVNGLGIENATPKKILEAMNVEGLTKYNVASHLQTYRTCLRRINDQAPQQANMVQVLGGMNPSSFHTLAGPRQFKSSSSGILKGLSSSSGILDRLNSPAVLGMPGIPSSGTIPLCHGQNSDKTANRCMLQGMPRSNEYDHLQPEKSIVGTNDLRTADGITTVVPFSSASGQPNNPPTGHSWSGGVPSSRIQPNSFPSGNLSGTLSRMTLEDGSVSSIPPLPNQLQGSEADFQFHAVPIDKNRGEIIRSAPTDWEGLQHPSSSYASNSLNPTIPIGGGGVGLLGESSDPTNRMLPGNTEFDSPGQSDITHPFPMITNEVQGSAMQSLYDPVWKKYLLEKYLKGELKL